MTLPDPCSPVPMAGPQGPALDFARPGFCPALDLACPGLRRPPATVGDAADGPSDMAVDGGSPAAAAAAAAAADTPADTPARTAAQDRVMAKLLDELIFHSRAEVVSSRASACPALEQRDPRNCVTEPACASSSCAAASSCLLTGGICFRICSMSRLLDLTKKSVGPSIKLGAAINKIRSCLAWSGMRQHACNAHQLRLLPR